MEHAFAHERLAPVDVEGLLNAFPPEHPFHNPANYENPLNVLTFDDGAVLAHVMHRAGIFKSVADARRNGWNRPIPPGYSEWVVTKRRIKIAIANLWEQ